MFHPQANTAPVEVTTSPWYKPPATRTFAVTDVTRFKPPLPAPDAGATAKPSKSRPSTSTPGARKEPQYPVVLQLGRSAAGRSIGQHYNHRRGQTRLELTESQRSIGASAASRRIEPCTRVRNSFSEPNRSRGDARTHARQGPRPLAGDARASRLRTTPRLMCQRNRPSSPPVPRLRSFVCPADERIRRRAFPIGPRSIRGESFRGVRYARPYARSFRAARSLSESFGPRPGSLHGQT